MQQIVSFGQSLSGTFVSSGFVENVFAGSTALGATSLSRMVSSPSDRARPTRDPRGQPSHGIKHVSPLVPDRVGAGNREWYGSRIGRGAGLKRIGADVKNERDPFRLSAATKERKKWIGATRCLLGLCYWGYGGARPANADTQVSPDAGWHNPKLTFATGQKAAGRVEMSSDLPAIPGPASGWFVAQWNKPYSLSGKDMRLNDPATRDPDLGIAKWSYTSPAGETSIREYATRNGIVYGLLQHDGKIVQGGGSDTFLSARPVVDMTFDHAIDYDLDAKVALASVRYDTPQARRRDSVALHAQLSFVTRYDPPDGGGRVIGYVQIPLVDSRGRPPFFTRCGHNGDAGENTRLVYDSPDIGQEPFPFEAMQGAPRHLHMRINDVLCDLITYTYRCGRGDEAEAFQLPQSAQNLRNWHLVSMTVGIEGGNQNLVHNPPDDGPQGSVALELQVGGYTVSRRDGETYGPSCPAHH